MGLDLVALTRPEIVDPGNQNIIIFDPNLLKSKNAKSGGPSQNAKTAHVTKTRGHTPSADGHHHEVLQIVVKTPLEKWSKARQKKPELGICFFRLRASPSTAYIV